MKLLKNNSKFLKKPSVSLLIGPYMKNFITTALLLSSGVFIAGQTTASTADATFKVKIEVVSTCAISATDIDFGEIWCGNNSNTRS
jgi:spore coat protein U-like protein